MPTAIIEKATGYVVEQGAVADGLIYEKVSCSTNPDARTQKWGGSAFISKTPDEISAYDVEGLRQDGIQELDHFRVLNAVIWALIDRINYPCTVTKFTNSRDKILEAYRAEPWKA